MSKKLFYYGSTASFSNLYSSNMDGVDEHSDAGDMSAFSFGDGAGNDLPFSLSAWMKRTNAAGNEIIISKFGSVGAYEWYLYLVGTTCWFGLWKAAGGAYIIRTAPMSTTGSWVHICATYDGSKATTGMKIYANATRIDNANLTLGSYSTTGMSNTISTLNIGSIQNGTGAFIGKIAHPAIFNKELTSAEVTEIYNKKMGDLRTTSVNTNLISAWYYPNGTSDYPTWTDYKNGYNATMQNQEAADINTDVPT